MSAQLFQYQNRSERLRCLGSVKPIVDSAIFTFSQ